MKEVEYAKSLVFAAAPKAAPPLKSPAAPPAPVVKKPTPPSPVQAPTPPPQAPVKPPVAPAPAPGPVVPIVRSNKDCVPLCEKRCELHSRKRVCMRACSTCCERCKCVPPGTYGNRELCGKCYTAMLTHGNRYKCP
ncbi:gibberellin-regulated protein 14-like [Senna tora]|uniref:Gibberellin-regulated protein 14-like n=1 Tax=Senna tora TaxID=362788 RepID=A0A834TCJ8_9FABA|nr:gibberellin-regulated protein 14-like [Senna tora]